jgi:hypothetical protein
MLDLEEERIFVRWAALRNGINFLDLGKMRAIMKRFFTAILLAVALCFCAGAGAQEIRGGNYGTVGYIKSDGTIQDSHYKTIGYIKSNGTIQDGSYRTIGYLKSDGTVQDSHYSTVGYIKSDGTVQDSHYSTIGYVKSDGTVQDSHYKTIGYAKNIPTRWAALFFFFKL